MIYPTKITRPARIGIVSLSSGVLGEPFASHEREIMERRLKNELGLQYKYMDNALKGEEYLKNHPDKKAEDLKQAFLDSEVDIIWPALGGDDTFRTLPFLMDDEFKKIIQEHPKPFLGFSDTTNNHLMFYRLGLATFYAPSLLADIAELGDEVFSYTRKWLNYLLTAEQSLSVEPSDVWYEARKNFGPDQVGVPRVKHIETHGHEYLWGTGAVEGDLIGGCLDSLYEMLVGTRYDDQNEIYQKYPIFPEPKDWENKIVFLETSEEKPAPEKLTKMLEALGGAEVFDRASALIIGKPQDEVYYNEYREIYTNFAKKYRLPTVFNLNFGHSAPRMILPYGRPMRIDFDQQKITLPKGLIDEKH